MKVDHVAALDVRRLGRLLTSLEEARPVFAQAHRPVDCEELLRDVDVLEAPLVGRRQATARVAVLPDLVRILGAVEADATGVVVVFANDARAVVLGGVCRRVDAQRALLRRAASRTGRSRCRALPGGSTPKPSVV